MSYSEQLALRAAQRFVRFPGVIKAAYCYSAAHKLSLCIQPQSQFLHKYTEIKGEGKQEMLIKKKRMNGRDAETSSA